MTVSERRGKGLYWDRALSLVSGCSPVSPGCQNCWSAAEAHMRSNHPNPKIAARNVGLTNCGTGAFNGTVRCNEDLLDLPLRVKKPTVWAIWTDLYHSAVPDSFRDRAYAVMALCPQHTFLVLTKRAERMAEYFDDGSIHLWDRSIDALPGGDNITVEGTYLECVRDHCDEFVTVAKDWPLPNVWHGVTAENQQAADERIPHLLQVPGKRFLSIEPMLGPIDLKPYRSDKALENIDAVLLGGESGKNARPMHLDWATDIRDQCAAASVPFFFKQWGEWAPDASFVSLRNPLHEWCDGEQITSRSWRRGKKAAGRTLDGRLHNDLPWGDK